MKQGRAPTKHSGMKTEPNVRPVSPKKVAQIGNIGRRVPIETVFEGKGYKAPQHKTSIRPRGTQGRH